MEENEFGFTPKSPETQQQIPPHHNEAVDDIEDEPDSSSPQPQAQQQAPALAQSSTGIGEKNLEEMSDVEIRALEITGLKDSESGLEGEALKTKLILSRQPKVRMMIPLDPGESKGAYRTVSINGYRFDIMKNVMVDLPRAVADLLSSSYQITNDVLSNHPTSLSGASEDKKRALNA